MSITDRDLAEFNYKGVQISRAVDTQNYMVEELQRGVGSSLELAVLVVGALGGVVTGTQPVTAPSHYSVVEKGAEAVSAPTKTSLLEHRLPTQKSVEDTVVSHQHVGIIPPGNDPNMPKTGINNDTDIHRVISHLNRQAKASQNVSPGSEVVVEVPAKGDTVDAMEERLGVTDEPTAVKMFDRLNDTNDANRIYAGKAVKLVDLLGPAKASQNVSPGSEVVVEVPAKGDTVDAMEERLGVTDEPTAVKMFDRLNDTNDANRIYAGKKVELVDMLGQTTSTIAPKSSIISGQPAPPSPTTARKQQVSGNVVSKTRTNSPSKYVGLEAAVERLAQKANESLSHHPAAPIIATKLSEPQTTTIPPEKASAEDVLPVKAQNTAPIENNPVVTDTTVPSDKQVERSSDQTASPNKDTSTTLPETVISKAGDQSTTTLDQQSTAGANHTKVHSGAQSAQRSPIAVIAKPVVVTTTTFPLYPPPPAAATQTGSAVAEVSPEQVPETSVPAAVAPVALPVSTVPETTPLTAESTAVSPTSENNAMSQSIEVASQAVANTVNDGLLNIVNHDNYSAAEFRQQDANSTRAPEPVISKVSDQTTTTLDQQSTVGVRPIIPSTYSEHHQADNSLPIAGTVKHAKATATQVAPSYPKIETVIGATGSEGIEALRLFAPETIVTVVTHPDAVPTKPVSKTDSTTVKPEVESIIMNDLDAIEHAFRTAAASSPEAKLHDKLNQEADNISPPATQQTISEADRVGFQKAGDTTRDEEGSNASQIASRVIDDNNKTLDVKPSTETSSAHTHLIPDNSKVLSETVTLKPGESTWSIASEISADTGVSTFNEVAAIEKANHISTNAGAHHLAVGDHIEAPLLGAAGTDYQKLVTYKTLPEVARSFGMTAAELLEMNPELVHKDIYTNPRTKLTLNVPKVNLLEQTNTLNNGINNESNGSSIATNYNGYEFVPIPQEYIPLILDAAKKFQLVSPIISPAFLAAILNTESHFNAKAESGAGALGIAQFEPHTFKGEELSPNESPFDPSDAIYAEANLLAGLSNYIQNATGINNSQEVIELASAGYNAGINAVKKYNWTIPPYTQTQDYVGRVIAAIPFYQQQINQYIAYNSTSASNVNTPTIPGNVGAVYGPTNVAFYSQWGNQNGNWDWANTSYSQYDSCAPTTEASIITTLTGHTVTPPELAEWNNINGEHDPYAGTEWSSFVESMQPYGLTSQKLDNLSEAAADIKAGGMVIVSGDGADPFTPDGHVLALRGIDAEGNFLVMNPNSSTSKPGDPNDSYSALQLEAAISPNDSNGMAIFAITKPSSETVTSAPPVTTTTVAPPPVDTTYPAPPLPPPVTTPDTAPPTTVESTPPAPSTTVAPTPIITTTTNLTPPLAVTTTVTTPPTTVESAPQETTTPVSAPTNTGPATNPTTSSSPQ